MSNVKVHFPTLPLQEAVACSGGITRENAVEAALENIRAISGEGDQTIEAAIKTLEAVVAAAGDKLTPAQLRTVLEQADQIVNMAGTFGYKALDRISRSLCDIADGLLRENLPDLAPVAVHIRALRLFSPLGTAPLPEAANYILDELRKVAAHYNFASLDADS